MASRSIISRTVQAEEAERLYQLTVDKIHVALAELEISSRVLKIGPADVRRAMSDAVGHVLAERLVDDDFSHADARDFVLAHMVKVETDGEGEEPEEEEEEEEEPEEEPRRARR